MDLFLNIVVLLFEILYYSLFMKFSRKEGKFYKYLLLFSFITLIGMFIGTNNLVSYMLLVIMMLFGLKYVVKVKTSLYDMLIIVLMIIFGVLVQFPCYLLLVNRINDIYVMMLLYQTIKLLSVFLVRNKINKMYKNLYIKWIHNDFYIRYLFSIFIFSYTILSCLFIIKVLL